MDRNFETDGSTYWKIDGVEVTKAEWDAQFFIEREKEREREEAEDEAKKDEEEEEARRRGQ